ncbi:MAG TPA: hypothetical protein VL349_03205, partial [Terriglobales bacterium]|nr:hypothetical protein [Terriglobales bacterium]
QGTKRDMNTPDMDGMDHHNPNVQAHSMLESIEQHATSGTDAEPDSTPAPMIMHKKGSWMLMFHGEAFINEIQQTGPRGADKFFSTNWFMPMAQRKTAKGTLTLRTMLSLEPATVSDRRYPELFQQGETAYGKPIIDGQHPHDFVMELAAMYDYNFNDHAALSFYAAPVGDPAMGPPAYPHRASTAEDPLAPLGHHLQDSTHIANDVVTVGLTYRDIRLEASGFYGREPDEYRWNIDSGKIDSWSTRFTINPFPNWSFQYSIGELASPEALFPDESVRRMTASLIYNRPLQDGNWASMALWGRNQNMQDGNVGNSYLLESTLRFLAKNSVWARIENVDRTTDVMQNHNPVPLSLSDSYFARVQAYTAGYDREFGRLPHVSTALGGQIMWYGVPSVLRTEYGGHPVGALVFLRLRAK